MNLIDTHAHLNFNNFGKDFSEVMKRSAEAGISMINVGTNYLTSKRAVEVAETYEGVYAAIGLHALNINPRAGENKTCVHSESILEKPEDFLECDFDADLYGMLANESKKIVAVGEVGLDYYYKPKTNKKISEMKEAQVVVLKKQLDFALELDLPVIFHCRMAHEDLIKLLEERSKEGREAKGVIHCFTATVEEMKKYLELGLYIGLNGIIFKMNLDEQIRQCPRDRIVLETDCPYLTPPQVEGRNEPAYLKYVAERVAQTRNESIEEAARYTTENAKKLFKI